MFTPQNPHHFFKGETTTSGGGGKKKITQQANKHFPQRSRPSRTSPLLLPPTKNTHKRIGTNTYTSKQRCHFTQEGSAVLPIRQGLVLGQRLLPNLRPPPRPPASGHTHSHTHPGDKLPIVQPLLINDSSPVQTNFRAHSKTRTYRRRSV